MKPPLSTEVFPLNIVLVAYLFLLFLCQGASSALHPYKKLYFSFTQNHWSPPFRNSNGTKPAGEGNTANVHFTNTPSPRAPNTQFLPAVCCWLRAHTHKTHTQPATAQTSPTSAPTKSPELFNSELEPGSSPAERQAALGKYRENVLSNKTLQTGLKRKGFPYLGKILIFP